MYHIKETGFVSTVLSELLWIIIKLHIQCSACIYIYIHSVPQIFTYHKDFYQKLVNWSVQKEQRNDI